jgi:hypothetical protein
MLRPPCQASIYAGGNLTTERSICILRVVIIDIEGFGPQLHHQSYSIFNILSHTARIHAIMKRVKSNNNFVL